MNSTILNLNKIFRRSHLGIYKRCLLNSKKDYSKLCDYMQKINFCVQDLNEEIKDLSRLDMKSIVYIIVLAAWVQEADEKIKKLYKNDAINDFTFKKDEEIKKANEYLKALRSFVVAHPLSTQRHSKFRFDGNYICVDIRRPQDDMTWIFVKDEQVLYLDLEGLHEGRNSNYSDYYLYVYSDKDDGMEFFRYIGCSINDVFDIVNLFIEELYALDRFLAKKKGFGRVNNEQA